jgi:hypothetical protein
MNLYAEQKIYEKTLLNKMKMSRDKCWIPTFKDEMKLLFVILLLQGIVQKPEMGDCFSRNRLLATPTFYGSMPEKRFLILLKLLHFADNEAYCGQVPPKIYKMKTVFDHLIKFSESYVSEDQLSIDKSLLLWKGHLGLHTKEKFSFWHGILQTV